MEYRNGRIIDEHSYGKRGAAEYEQADTFAISGSLPRSRAGITQSSTASTAPRQRNE